ncbi:MAG: MG2 domain-containing protein, partial [Flavobacteriales bacterium]
MSFQAARILQALTTFHAMDVDPAALVDVELKRLKFAKEKSALGLKDSLYRAALEQLMEKYSNHPSSAEVAYHLANAHCELALKYKPPVMNEHRWERKKAMEICNAAISKHKNSFGASNCRYLLEMIKTKDLKFDVEHVNVPAAPFLALLHYRNVNKVYFRIARADFETYRKYRMKRYDQKWMDYLRGLKSVREWSLTLEDDGDYQEHKTEIKIPAVEKGFYVLLAGTDPDLSYSENGLAYKSFWCSDISYFVRNRNDGTYDIRTQDRTTGSPMAGVTAKLYYQKYNYTLRMYEWRKFGTYISDNDGYIKVPAAKDYRNFSIEFSKAGDLLNTEDSYYQYNYSPNNRAQINTHFFTDRAIYRPGQTIYFKGIVIETQGDENRIKANYTSTVTMFDVNYQKVADLKLTSNEYGTFSGSFTAPTSALNGQMHITDNHGTVYFRIEEYKRPKFEVVFNPVKGSFRLDDTVRLEGRAMAYAGAVVDGAKVQYRVVRNASFPFWGYWRGWYPTSPQMEIAHGVTVTDESGNFKLNFKAVPDKGISKKYRAQYSYTVTADITDINGETHSAQQVVNVGYTALTISTDIPEQISQNGQDSFHIKTLNLMGEEESASGTLRFYRLEPPEEKMYRNRDWDRPDKFVMSKEEFAAGFPLDVYDNENDVSTWKKGSKVYERAFDTKKSTDVVLYKLPEWEPGRYIMEAACKDKYGEEVTLVKYLRVFSTTKKHMPFGDVAWFVPLKKEAEPGEQVDFMVGSAGYDVHLLYEIEQKGKIIQREGILLNSEQKRISIPVKEEYRGNFAIHLAMVKNNRAYTFGQVIIVPHSDKKL